MTSEEDSAAVQRCTAAARLPGRLAGTLSHCRLHGISNQDQIGRSYAPKGQTPVVPWTAKRISRSMISAVSNRGLMRFMLYEAALNAAGFIAFLRRLIKDAGQKVVLIVDNLKVHHAGRVAAWVASHAYEIELCCLPCYAPDHNPSEYLNNDLEQQLRQQP